MSVHCLCLLKIAEGSIPCAGVKLHVGNNIQSSRQLLLRQTVLYCGLQDQLKDCLQVCIGTLIEGSAEADFLDDIPALDFHKLRSHGESDKVVVEGTMIVLRKIDCK